MNHIQLCMKVPYTAEDMKGSSLMKRKKGDKRGEKRKGGDKANFKFHKNNLK